MTRQELNTLYELATKLRNERLEETKKENDLTDEDVEEWYDEDWYDLDDGDNLLQGLDIVLAVVKDMKPTE